MQNRNSKGHICISAITIMLAVRNFLCVSETVSINTLIFQILDVMEGFLIR